jgi:hypothetical protein
MKHKYLFLVLLMLALCCNSCKDNLFDFDVHNVEADGEWGLPVFNGTLTVDRVLSHLDSVQYVQVGADGTVTFVIEEEANNVVKLSDFFSIPNQQFDSVGTASIDQLPNFELDQVIQFSLSNDDVVLHGGTLKTGIFSLNFFIQATDFWYTATLTTNNILTPEGSPLTLVFSNSQTVQTVDMSNYRVSTPDGQIVINAHISVQTGGQLGQQLGINCHVTLNDFSISAIQGELIHDYAVPNINETIGFSMSLDKFRFDDIRINNARLLISGRNSLCSVIGTINQLYLFNQQGIVTPLINSPLTINAPLAPNEFIPLVDHTIPSIYYDMNMDSLKFNADLTVKAAQINVTENSTLDLQIKAELPANLCINNAVYRDTVENSLQDALQGSIIESIDNLVLRIAFTHNFPFDLTPHIKFRNSTTGEEFPLNLGQLQIHGAYNGIPYVQEPFFLEFSQADAHKIATYDQMVMFFTLTTNNHDVEIKNTQYIRAAIGAKINYSNITMN